MKIYTTIQNKIRVIIIEYRHSQQHAFVKLLPMKRTNFCGILDVLKKKLMSVVEQQKTQRLKQRHL